MTKDSVLTQEGLEKAFAFLTTNSEYEQIVKQLRILKVPEEVIKNIYKSQHI